MVGLGEGPTTDELAFRARARQYEQQIRKIRRKHFAARGGNRRGDALRAAGLDQLREFVDPAAFRPMIEVLGDERDDVRLFMLDHFAGQSDEGQAALAWVAITHEDDSIRNEAISRLVAPAATPVKRVLDATLRSPKHAIANNAASVAGAIGILDAIPLLIFAMNTRDPRPSDEGDLAWIAIGTQQAFIANLVPVVGDSAGAFQPVLGVLNEGIVLRVSDAVVVVYRTIIYRVLVGMTTEDWGESTAHLGHDMRAWWTWYNEEYVPFKNEQARLASLAEPEVPTGDGAGSP